MPARPLEGLRVLDFSRVYSGPLATLLLADMGAEVIKIEHPAGGDDSRSFGPFIGTTSGYFETLNRGKKSVALDYTAPQGQSILRAMIGQADVLVENFRPDRMAKYGLDYAALSAEFPGLVYASISGFGADGPEAGRGCYDIVAQAEGGLMGLTGLPDHPIKTGPPVADALSGLMAATGLLAALFRRGRTGEGAHVEISMVDTVFACLENALAAYDITRGVPSPNDSRDGVLAPFDAFQTADSWVVIGIGNDRLWRIFAALVDQALADDPRFATNTGRVANYDVLRPQIGAWCAAHPTAYLLALLHQHGIPSGAVRGIDELACDARLEARGMLARLALPGGDSLMVPGSPIRIDGITPSYRRGPQLGEDTLVVCSQIPGLDRVALEALHTEGILHSLPSQASFFS